MRVPGGGGGHSPAYCTTSAPLGRVTVVFGVTAFAASGHLMTGRMALFVIGCNTRRIASRRPMVALTNQLLPCKEQLLVTQSRLTGLVR